jgi:diacylglycerol kinase family enzyme
MNQKGFEAPELWECIRLLQEKSGLVSLTGEDPDAYLGRIAGAGAWVVVGGDGTLNHVVNSLMKIAAEKRCPVCYVPYGTGNDFARTVGLGEAAPLELLQAALGPGADFLPVTVGECGSSHFVNMATGGIFATVTPEANPAFKNMAGRWAYFIHGIGKLLERETVNVSVNGAEAVPALGFFVANARFAGGGVQVLSRADPFDPNLEFLLVPDMPTKDLLALGLELQKDSPDLSAFPVRVRKVSRLRLAFDREVPINLDGEQVRLREAAFAVAPKAFRIFTPKARAGAGELGKPGGQV